MLSNDQYKKLLHQINNIPSNITGKKRKTIHNKLRKQIHEHELASRYPPFEPLNYKEFFINCKTEPQTLQHLINMITISKFLILDTESITIYQQPNRPALIQLQMVLHNSPSYIIFTEAYHLPNTETPNFLLIIEFFKSLFALNNTIYIWGLRKELEPFIKFKLFSLAQLNLANIVNLQNKFKIYWNEYHPHTTRSISTNDQFICDCETCLGINENNLWSLQDAMAYHLNRWLDKRQTISSFNIGLDPTLTQLDDDELQDREIMRKYAAYDCLSIHQLLISMDIHNTQRRSFNLPSQSSSTSIPTTTTTTNDPIFNINDLEVISSDDDEVPQQQPQQSVRTVIIKNNISINNNQPNNPLTEAERKHIHNRSCTLKQRKRYYRDEILIHNIDRRFTIKQIKNILRSYNISFYAVNFSTSLDTHQRSLRIGIRDPSKFDYYQNEIKHLFTTSHYRHITKHTSQYRSSD